MEMLAHSPYAAEKAYELEQDRLARSKDLAYRMEWEAMQAPRADVRRRLVLRLGTALVRAGERLQGWALPGLVEWDGP